VTTGRRLDLKNQPSRTYRTATKDQTLMSLDFQKERGKNEGLKKYLKE
jgi:hypothetical protein